ncbi:MAG: hypothetical protein HDR01_15495 [Lachnospiraceae bacterium]|nr:hypothetical protein [Lachnospiraceae bacterium]
MNDRKKKQIIIGILSAILILLAGCGKKEVTFIQTEEIQEKEGQLSGENAYNEQDEGSKETEEPRQIFVYVCGAVECPGVYELSEDARAFEAIEKAGGFSPEAYEEALNLAKPLEDGEQLLIPTLEEWEQGKAALDEAEGNEASDGLVNINTASKEELCTLSGVGESRAESIIAYREEHGGFMTIEDIKNVTGIKEGLFSKIKDKIKVK